MSSTTTSHPDISAAAAERRGPGSTYRPPHIVLLGGLDELTRGGTVSSQSDGSGFAGASGTI